MFTPTEEQLAIIDEAENSEANILVVADAGAAKTSTLDLIARRLTEVQMLYLVFNKRNQLEAQERLPPNCKPMTLNGLGHRTWMEATGRKLRLERSKTYDILSALVQELGPDDKNNAFKKFAELMQIVDRGKLCGYVPTGSYERAKRLMDCDQFFNHIEQKLSEWEMQLVRNATLAGLKQSFEGLIDYNDQILMPTVFMGAYPRYPLVLVDEFQDLSLLNQATLRKLVKKRLIGVGDPNQAIYAFREAHANSMFLLQQEFSMKAMRLSINFRCSKEVIRHSRWKSPSMRWPEWAPEGKVSTLRRWSAQDIPENAAIICRNNAPLFATAIRLLLQGRPSEIGSDDVVKSISKIMRKFGSSDLSQANVLDQIDLWSAEQKAKTKEYAHKNIEDRAECMRIFARQGDNLGDALAYAQHLVQQKSRLKMLTGHKAKGLEFDHVFFLDAKLVGNEDQELNLRHVIITRAKETLTYINSEDFIRETEEMRRDTSATVSTPTTLG